MKIGRRHFIGMGMAGLAAAAIRPSGLLAGAPAPELQPMTAGIVPISGAEHLARIARARN
jgi:hypothetical protein